MARIYSQNRKPVILLTIKNPISYFLFPHEALLILSCSYSAHHIHRSQNTLQRSLEVIFKKYWKQVAVLRDLNFPFLLSAET